MKKTCFLFILMWNLLVAQDKSERQGFAIGVALGGGIISIKDSEKGNYFRFSIPNLKVGYMINDHSVVYFYIPTGIYVRDSKKRAFEAIMPSYQYWIKDKLFVLAGVGLNLDFPVLGTSNKGFYVGPAMATSLGLEIWKNKSHVIDLQLRYQYGSSKVENDKHRSIHGMDIVCGYSWY